jgi:hypothetical protein
MPGESGSKGYRGDIGEPGMNGRDGYEFHETEAIRRFCLFYTLVTMVFRVHLAHEYASRYNYLFLYNYLSYRVLQVISDEKELRVLQDPKVNWFL